MDRHFVLVALFGLALFCEVGALLSRTYVERLQFETGFESCMAHSNYVSQHILTRRQKWQVSGFERKQGLNALRQ